MGDVSDPIRSAGILYLFFVTRTIVISCRLAMIVSSARWGGGNAESSTVT